MKAIKILLPLASLVALAFLCRQAYEQPATQNMLPIVAQATDRPTQQPTATPTATVIPSATIDYQQTAAVAQSTAMEAVRINAQITAEFEQRAQEQLQMTAEADREYFTILSWTQQAASTVIPLTATQQAVLNTQIPQQQQLAFAQITATWGAPTQVIAFAKAEQDAKFGTTRSVIGIVGGLAVSLFCIVMAVYVARLMLRRVEEITVNDEQQDDEELQDETVIWIAKDNGQGTSSKTRSVVPCTPQQLTELAELAVNGERTFAINRLENNSRTLRRDTLYAFRNWAVSNAFATHPKPGNQEIVMNDEGVCFLEGWFENHLLPEGLKFEEGEELEPA